MEKRRKKRNENIVETNGFWVPVEAFSTVKGNGTAGGGGNVPRCHSAMTLSRQLLLHCRQSNFSTSSVLCVSAAFRSKSFPFLRFLITELEPY